MEGNHEHLIMQYTLWPDIPQPQKRKRQPAFNRQDYLESLIPSSDLCEVTLEFRGKGGWVLSGSARWIGDDGEDILGSDWKEAEAELRWRYGKR